MSITTQTENGIALITIDRPARKNALLLSMRAELEAVFRAAQDDDAVRCVVITGAGTDFSAGADISEMGGGGTPGSLMRMRMMHRMVRAVAATHKPVIAAVRGVCIGMSWALALTCDLVITAEDARFQFAFRHIALAMDGGAAYLLTRHVGLMRAKEIVYSGRFVSGTEAASLGLALEALPADDVLPRAMALAAGFATAPTIAIGMAKRQFDAANAQTLDQALDFEANIQPLMVTTEDFREGARAFGEKRKPDFKGS